MNAADIDIAALRAKTDGFQLVVSVSGGKDSTACCLWLQELGLPYTAVHMDTGWEHTATFKYVREVLPAHIGPITIIRAEVELPPHLEPIAVQFEAELGQPYSAMIRTILKKGMFSSKARRFCTQELKVFPAQKHLNSLPGDVINVVGIRHEESKARAAMPEWEWSEGFDCEVWRPILKWTLQDVIDVHHRNGVPPNPLYTMGATRVGCWPCVFTRKAELRMIAESDPDRITLIERLEKAVYDVAAARYAKDGETFQSLGYIEPAWFQNPRPPTEDRVDPTTGKVKRVRTGGPVPIRDVVAWSMTKNASDELEPFAALPSDDGCIRWGLCDTSWRKPVASAVVEPIAVVVAEPVAVVVERPPGPLFVRDCDCNGNRPGYDGTLVPHDADCRSLVQLQQQPTSVEFFAGAGGASLGLHAAGFRSLVQVEFDPSKPADKQYAALPTVVHGREAGRFRRRARRLPLVLRLAGPDGRLRRKPAYVRRNLQPFRIVLPHIEALHWSVSQLPERLRGKLPTFTLWENVPGLVSHRGAAKCQKGKEPKPGACPRCYFDGYILPELRKRYAVVDWRILECADFGVPPATGDHRRGSCRSRMARPNAFTGGVGLGEVAVRRLLAAVRHGPDRRAFPG